MAIVARWLLVLGLLAAFPALAQQEPQQEPPGRVGRVGIISGTLAFYGTGDSEWSAAAVNLPVATGGWFATDPKSRAQLRIGPDTISLAEDTQLNIADLRDGVMQLALSQGRIGLQLHRPAWRKDQTAEIDIARGGVWLLQPGEYDIDAGAPDQPTRISVFEGSARFVGGGVDKVVKAGERLILTGTDTLTASIERAEPDDFANWCRDHGIRQDRVAAARRVSPAMTGFEELEEHGEWAEAADYGAVWYPKSLPADWAPYRAGRWVWVEPWGWNWVDDQPWGFAPFHYGRWAQVNDRWGWVPGEFVAEPVYAPALVAFLPQPTIEIAVAADAGPPVGWFPLAPGEVYWPSYTRSPTYIRNVNITNVRINLINQVTTAMLTRRGTAEPPPLVLNQRFVNRPAATIVPAQVVMRSAPVAPAVVRVPDRDLRQARVAALPPPVVARPAVAAAIAAAAMPRHGRQPPPARPSAGAPNAAPPPAQPHLPARPNFAQLARAPRLGHGAAAAIPAALPGAATAPAAPPAGSPHRPAEVPAATAVIPPLAPHQPPAAANAAPPARPGPPGRPDFTNLPRWRPHGGPQQAQSGVPTPPSVPPSAEPAARQHAAQELAQQRAAAATATRQQQLGQRAAQQQAIAEQRAAREQARAAQLAQQRAAAEATGNHQAQQRIARQQAIAEQRAAREQARAVQLGQQRAAAEAARGQLTEQRAARQQAIAAQQAQQRAAAEAARQHQAQQRAAQQGAAQQAAAQRAAQQQAIAAQQAQQRAAQQGAAQQAAAQRAAQQQAAQQAAAQRAAQQQAAQQAAAQRAAQQQAAQQAAAQRAAQQQAAQQAAAQRAAQQQAAQQAAAQRAAQQQAMAAQQAQQRAAQQQQKQAHKQPPCGGPGQPACPQH